MRPFERFVQFIDPQPNGCWYWVGRLTEQGYAQFHPTGRADLTVRANRWAYGFFVGLIPAGLHVDHICRTRRCVNPDHLEAVTPQENARRRSAALPLKTHCPSGHPYQGGNIYYAPQGYRQCRVCKREAKQRQRERVLCRQ